MRFFPWKKKTGLSDEELIRSYQNGGDKAYVGELYIRYAHLMYGVCLKYYRDKEKARDAVLQIFEKLFDALRKHNPENVKTWLMFVARNYCISDLRKEQVADERRERFAAEETSATEETDTEELFKKEERLKRLELAVSSLGEEQRMCIELFYLKDKSYKEICDETGMSEKQVKSHIQNGKRNLKLILGEQ